MKSKKSNKITNEVIEQTALRIISDNPEPVKNTDIELWNRYNSSYGERFDYLTKVGEFDLPMNERRIPLQRKYIDLLTAKKSVRPFKYSVYLDSEDTRAKKLNDKMRSFIEFGLETSEQVAATLSNNIQNIDGNIQQIKQMMQQAAQQGEQPSPEDQAKYLGIIQDMNLAKQDLERQSSLNDDFIKEFESKQKHTGSEIIERIATKYMKYLSRVVDFNYISTMQFKNRIVTGKQNYMVAKFGDSKPTIRGLDDAENIVYQKGGNQTSIQKKDWAYYSEKMSFVQILENFSEQLVSKYGEQCLYKLRDMYSPNTGNSEMWALPDGGVIFGDEINSSISNNFNSSPDINIKWVWFRAGEIINRKTSIDKHGNIHKHIMPRKTLINKDEYSYNRGKYINKKNKNVRYKKDEVSTFSKKSGDKIDNRSFKKLYHAIVINDEYVIEEKEWKNIVRDEDNYNRFNLPIFGDSFDGITKKPYSLIEATNDIQDLIDIIWTSRDYMIAAAGTKGNVIDSSQKPDGMDQTEWEYHIKLGRMYIQTIDANGSAKRTSFNQWQTYDNSVSQSITYFDGMLINLEKLMGSVIGVPYQALGETTSTDQVGTNKIAIRESGLVTELMFYEHYINDKDALEEFISLMIADADGEDIIFSKPNMKNTSEYILNSKKLLDENIKLNLYSLSDDTEKINEIKGMAVGMIEKLNLPFSNLIKIFNTETVKEMEVKFSYFEDQARKLASQSNAQAKQDDTAIQKDLQQFTHDLDVHLEKMKAQFQQGNLQLEATRLEFDREKLKVENQAKLMEISVKNDKNKIDMMKVREDTAVEKAMLISDDKHRTFDDKLRSLTLEVELFLEKQRLKIDKLAARNVNVPGANQQKTSSNERINDK